MEWLIVLGVVLFVAAPVMWLKPNPRQTRQNALRSFARKEGIEVKLAAPPLHNFKGFMPGYRFAYEQKAPGPNFVLVRDAHASEALEHFHAGWRWRIAPLRPLPTAADASLKALLERLPTDALVIESSAQAMTLWWWESQGPERFTLYLEAFRELTLTLAGQADHLALSASSR